MPGGSGDWLLLCNISYIIAALCTGNNVAVCGQLQIGIFNSCTAELQFCRTFAKRWHAASGRNSRSMIRFFVMFIYLKIQAFFIGNEKINS